MRIGILGGSFNPPHIGHLNIAKIAIEKFSFDKLLIIPCKTPVHKEINEFASSEDRIEMCRRTFDIEGVEISDIEIISDRESYTFYTLKELSQIYKDAKFYFIIGCDMLFYFKKWFMYKELFSLAIFVVFARESDSEQEIMNEIKELSSEGGRFLYIKSDETIISSSEIRKDPVEKRFFLKKSVYEYIEENNIYKGIKDE